MFGIVRMLFWLLVFGICIVAIKKHNIRYNKLSNVFFIATILGLWIFSMFVPIENMFMKFKTPENAFKYVSFENVKTVVYGKKSAFVIGEGNESNYLIVPKGKDGWKIGRGLDTIRLSNLYVDGIIVRVYQYKTTKEYFVEIANMDGEKYDLSHNRESAFIISENKNSKINLCQYYTYVYDLDENYVLKVNDQKIFPGKHSTY